MIRRGDVYFVELGPAVGHEQAGRRPVVVVSDDDLNRLDLVLTVVVGTSAPQGARRYTTNVLVTADESGLPRDTTFLCFQVRSLDRSRFVDPRWNAVRRIGRLSPQRLTEIDDALRCALSL
jgi:mRNA interferase MazF